jgi:uncharacterized membrane protein YccC
LPTLQLKSNPGTISVTHISKVSLRLRAAVRRRRPQLALAVRVTVAALVALVLAQLLHLALPLWSVLTAVIVTQMSVGRSLKATLDYLIGTLGGAIYGGAIGVMIPHASEIALLAVVAVAVAPLAVIAATRPSLSVAPITAIIVLLVPTITHASPIASATDRVFEVALGGGTGLAVSLLLFPASAHRQVAQAAARALNRIAAAFGELLAGLTQGLDAEAAHRIQDGIGEALAQLNVVGAEAERERGAHLATGPDTGPLLRTLLRLRHDLVMIGRAAISPLPQPIATRLAAPLARARVALTDYLRASATALLARRGPPPLADVETALDAYAAEIQALRREGLTATLPGDTAERFFALGFALEQMHSNCKDLERCVTEWGETLKPPAGNKPV